MSTFRSPIRAVLAACVVPVSCAAEPVPCPVAAPGHARMLDVE